MIEARPGQVVPAGQPEVDHLSTHANRGEAMEGVTVGGVDFRDQNAQGGGARGRHRRPGVGEGTLGVVRDDQGCISSQDQGGKVEVLPQASLEAAKVGQNQGKEHAPGAEGKDVPLTGEQVAIAEAHAVHDSRPPVVGCDGGDERVEGQRDREEGYGEGQRPEGRLFDASMPEGPEESERQDEHETLSHETRREGRIVVDVDPV